MTTANTIKHSEPAKKHSERSQIREEIALFVSEKRKQKGIGTNELAIQSECSASTIKRIESGEYAPDIYLTGKILRALDCDIKELFDRLF